MSWTGLFLQATLMLSGMTDLSDSNICVDYYSPVVNRSSIRSVESVDATWSAMDQLCKNTHFSYNMVQRAAVWMDASQEWEPNMCIRDPTTVIPVRMKRAFNRTVYWINDYGIEDEKLTVDELALIDPIAMSGLNTFGGVVYDGKFALTFVSRGQTFNCALCEILRRKCLSTPFGPPPPPLNTIVEYWVHVNALAGSPVDQVRRDIANVLHIPVEAIEHENTTFSYDSSAPTGTTTETSESYTTTQKPTLPKEIIPRTLTSSTTETLTTQNPTNSTYTPSIYDPTYQAASYEYPGDPDGLFMSSENIRDDDLSSRRPNRESSEEETSESLTETTTPTTTTESTTTPTTTTESTTTPTTTTESTTTTTTESTTSTTTESTTSTTTESTTSTTTEPTSIQTGSSIDPTGGSSTLAANIEVQVYKVKRTNADPLLPHPNNVTTPVYFNITSIDSNHYCAGEAVDDPLGNRHYWPDTKPGVVVVKRNKKDGGTTLTSRECTYDNRLFASWTDPTAWSETWKDCSSPITPGDDDQETLDNASDYLDKLADVPVLSRQLEEIADVVSEVIKLDEQVLTSNDESTTQIVQDLETIVSNMVIESGDVVNSTQSNLAIVVSDVMSSTDTVVGITISSGSSDELVLELVRSSTQAVISNQTQVRTVLSPEMVRRHTRLAFMVFPNGKLFPSRHGSRYKTNSHIINVILVNDNISTHTFDDEYIEIAFQPFAYLSTKKVCGFWDFTKNDWETDGCELRNATDSHLDVCRCTHLTNFAEIITGGSSMTAANEKALGIISLVGCTFSMSALLAIALTAILFEHWRRELSNKILLHMSAAIALNLIAYCLLASVRTQPNSPGCIVIGVILHYSVLTCFFWMLVMSTLQLLRLVTMMGAKSIPNLLLKITLFAWGVPLIPIIVTLSIDPHIYATVPETALDRDLCYPKGVAYNLTLLAPVAIIMAINLVVFVVIIFRIHSWCGWGKLETLERHGLTDRSIAMRRFKTIVLLFFLFGLTWLFGLFATNTVFAYLFCITATLQGFVLFVFLVLLERKTSGYWKTAIADISNKSRPSETSRSGSKISETSFRSLPFSK